MYTSVIIPPFKQHHNPIHHSLNKHPNTHTLQAHGTYTHTNTHSLIYLAQPVEQEILQVLDLMCRKAFLQLSDPIFSPDPLSSVPALAFFSTFHVFTRPALCKTLNNTSTDRTKPLALWLIIGSYRCITILSLSAEIRSIAED